jgi:hypothetical protein
VQVADRAAAASDADLLHVGQPVLGPGRAVELEIIAEIGRGAARAGFLDALALRWTQRLPLRAAGRRARRRAVIRAFGLDARGIGDQPHR